MDSILKFPFYAKAALLLIGLYVFVSILSIAQDIILPVIYAVIIAVSISPVVNALVEKKINRALAITAVLTSVLFIIIVFIVLLSSQASRLSEAWPQLSERFQGIFKQTISWTSGYFDISVRKINTWIDNAKTEYLQNSGAFIGTTLSTVGGVLATALLTPVYTYMLLFYQPHLLKFTHMLFGGGRNSNEVNEILTETKVIIQSYLVGLFAEFVIIAILNSVGLLILGIDYAVLLGIVGALLNIIPYLGGLIGVVLFIVVAMATKEPVYGLYVIGLYSLIQLIDNNYIVPKIVGSKVKLNAFICLVAVIAGAALWGIPGMFLSIPLTAIVKLLFDRIDSLKPWGFLMGDTTPPLLTIKPIFKRVKNNSL